MPCGIRVCKIPKEVQDKHLKIYFSKPSNGGGDIEKIYFPLFNNDAVILYKQPRVVEEVIKKRHSMLNKEVEVQCLPEHMIFSSIEAILDMNASVLLQAYEKILDEMRYDQGITVVEGVNNTIRLKGNWFQLEWAWHYIDCVLQHQEIIQGEMKLSESRSVEIVEDVNSDVSAMSRRAKSPSDVNLELRMSISNRSKLEASLEHQSLNHLSHDVHSSHEHHSFDHSSLDGRSTLNSRKERSLHPGSIGESASSINSLKSNSSIRTQRHAWETDEPYSHGRFQDRRESTDEEMSADEFELQGQGYKIPFASVHSSLGMGNRERREDENSVFEDFSGLLSMQRQQERSEAESHSRTNSVSDSLVKRQPYTDQTQPKTLSIEKTPKYVAAVTKEKSQGQYSSLTLEQSSYQQPTERFQSSSATQRSHEAFSSLPTDMTQSRSMVAKPDSKLQSAVRNSHDGQVGTDHIGTLTASLNERGYSSPVSAARSLPATHFPERYTEELLSEQFDIKGMKVTIYYGDITKEETEVIVNAANEDLDHTGGVAYALRRARGCGDRMQQECNDYIKKCGRLRTTEVMHSSGGGEVKAGHIVHAAGPMWLTFREEEVTSQIAQTFLNCFTYANDKLWARSIALPAISSGVYGAPLDRCVRAFLDAILVFVKNTGRESLRIRDIRLVNNDAEATVTSIVLLQTVLEEGIEKLTMQALKMFHNYDEKEQKLNIPKGRPELSGSFSKTYSVTNEPLGRTSRDITPNVNKSSHRRSSSLSRIPDKSSNSTEKTSSSQRDRRLEYDYERRSQTGRTRERTGSFSSTTSKSTNVKNSPREKSTAGSVGRESPRMSEKSPANSSRVSRTTPQIKPNLISNDRMKSFHMKSSTAGSTAGLSARNKLPSQRSRDKRNPAIPGSMKSDLLDYSHEERHGPDEFGMHSLPADIHKGTSYREKFLQTQQPQREQESDNECAICLDVANQPQILPRCKHVFCRDCIKRHFKTKPTCPVCNMIYGEIRGDQPKDGKMTFSIKRDTFLPGFEREDGTIVITYNFPDGIQKTGHPSPGKGYKGLNRKAYLPNSIEGREILRMLQKAFDLRLVFTIGQSRSTGACGVLTWNDLHHKTNTSGGPTKYGYPDRDYLKRIREELADKGITSDS